LSKENNYGLTDYDKTGLNKSSAEFGGNDICNGKTRHHQIHHFP